MGHGGGSDGYAGVSPSGGGSAVLGVSPMSNCRQLPSWGRNYQCPAPVAPSLGATIPLQTPGDGVSRRFQYCWVKVKK
ncbi:hypothetical protein [Nostoc sp. CHAB 5715]|uniref:hypothetical protein n=1 Tax=Nostoc sp. CHAB 5715 TaxID=2780400 RepID=UPI001E517D83|nr:hypothetical protein [Nostoc sp. CHAB 5715]MCC5620033.1 hypothetical protein [Nostoc sp. CHAB 5715]